MDLLALFNGLVTEEISRYGYAAILVLMLFESACVPIPREVTMWKRACGNHWGLKTWVSFQSVRNGTTAVTVAARAIKAWPEERGMRSSNSSL